MTTLVIGARVIGITLAYELQKRERKVTVIERDAPGKGASHGNMASIAVTESMPASRPTIWKRIPGWMLDPEGPVRVRPSYMPKMVPWFLRFIAASRPSKLRALEAQGAALCARVHADLGALLRETGLESELTAEGCLSLYQNEAEFTADREHIDILERFDVQHWVNWRQAIKALEPELSDKICMAVMFPENRSMHDPYQFVLKLVKRFKGKGGETVNGEVAGFIRAECIRAVLLKDGQQLVADEVVVCAGAHSVHLARMLGEPIPLETECGYHTQIMVPGISM